MSSMEFRHKSSMNRTQTPLHFSRMGSMNCCKNWKMRVILAKIYGKRRKGAMHLKFANLHTQSLSIEIFADLSFVSLRSIYRNMKSKKRMRCRKTPAEFARLHAPPPFVFRRPRWFLFLCPWVDCRIWHRTFESEVLLADQLPDGHQVMKIRPASSG